MAVNDSRSKRGSLIKGAMEGKYYDPRPMWETFPGVGAEIERANKAPLLEANGFLHVEYGSKVNPGG